MFYMFANYVYLKTKFNLHKNILCSHAYIKDASSVSLYTLIIGHKSCNMLSILNKLTMQKEMQNLVTNNVFLSINCSQAM